MRDQRDTDSAKLVQPGTLSQVQSGPSRTICRENALFNTQKSRKDNPNGEITRAARQIEKHPNDEAALRNLVESVVDALSRKPGSRRQGRKISIPKRIAQLLRTYACNLDPATMAELRLRCAVRADEVGVLTEFQQLSKAVPLRGGAMIIGLTTRTLAMRLCDPSYRRALGWPRPFGGDVLIARDVLDPATAAAYLKNCPAHEPWPKSTWPEGWRS